MTKGGFFLALSITILCNLTCQLLWGTRGLDSFKQLSDQQILLESHLKMMQRDYSLLEDRLNRLQYSGETLMAEAGQLNYIQNGESLIFLGNWNEVKLGDNLPEIVWYQPVIQKDRTSFFRALSLTLGLIVLLIKWTIHYIRKKERNSDGKGFSHIL